MKPFTSSVGRVHMRSTGAKSSSPSRVEACISPRTVSVKPGEKSQSPVSAGTGCRTRS